jgi:hypothetical protein
MIEKEHSRKIVHGHVFIHGEDEYKVLFKNIKLDEEIRRGKPSPNSIHGIANHILTYESNEKYNAAASFTEKRQMLYDDIIDLERLNKCTPLPYDREPYPSFTDYIIIQIISVEENVKKILDNYELKSNFTDYLRRPIANSLRFYRSLMSNLYTVVDSPSPSPSPPLLRDYIIIQIISEEQNVIKIMDNAELKSKFTEYLKHPIENSLGFSIALISYF